MWWSLASATPVIVEDDVVIGANAVVIEGIRIGKGAVVAAGAVVIEDVPAGRRGGGKPRPGGQAEGCQDRGQDCLGGCSAVSFDLVFQTVSACGRRRFFDPLGPDMRSEPINFSGTAKI